MVSVEPLRVIILYKIGLSHNALQTEQNISIEFGNGLFKLADYITMVQEIIPNENHRLS